MKRSKKSLSLKAAATMALAAFTALPAAAQSQFGVWTEASAEKAITKKFSVDGGIEFRAENDLKTAARWSASLGAGYKLLPWLSVSGGYAYLYDRTPQTAKVSYKRDGATQNGWNVDHGYWRSKHRAFADLTGKLALGRFTFSLRERYQYTYNTAASTTRDKYRGLLTPPTGLPEGVTWTPPAHYEANNQMWSYDETVVDDKSGKSKHYLRSRLAVEYNIKKCRFTPTASIELNNNLSDAFSLDKKRFTAGVDWKLSKHHRLSLAYLFQTGEDDDDAGDLHAIKIGYKFKF